MNPYRIKLFILIFLLVPTISSAQFYFGRNKIQYEQFEWKKLRTKHFEIFYYSGAEELSSIAAGIAEEAFPIMERKFNFTFNEPIPLIIYSSHIHFQQTNILPHFIPEGVGGFFEFMKGRVAIPFMGDLQDFKHVIRHELVHVFMHRKVMYHLNNEGINDPPLIPLWFSEGLAELWSQEWTSQAEMIIRDAVIHDELLLLDSYELASKGYLLYKEGESFLRFFQSKYGDSQIRKILAESGRYNYFSQAVSDICGKTYGKIMEEWRNHLKNRISSEENYIIDTLANFRQLTKKGPNTSPVIYKDSSGSDHLIYLSNRSGYTDFYSINLESGKEQKILKGERKSERESLHFLQTGMDVNRAGILVYVAKSGGADALRLYDFNQRKELKVFSHPKLISISSPCWSEDDHKIVFSAQDFQGRVDLYLWNPNDSDLIRLTKDFFNDRDPRFSPDGRGIVFSSDRNMNESNDLFYLDLDSVTIRILTQDGFQNTRPRWDLKSPDQIHFISDRTGIPGLWSLNLTGNNSEIVINHYNSGGHGVVDAVKGSDGRLIINQFREYSFQLAELNDESADSEKLKIQINAKKSQPFPAFDSLSVDSIRSVPYTIDYSLDFAQTAVAFDPIYGFLGGGQLAISDVLGNRYYHFLLANTASVSSEIMNRFNIAVTLVNLEGRSNIAWSAFHFANDFYNPYDAFYFERMIGLRAGINYPINVFRRIELSSSLWYSSKDYYDRQIETAYLASNFFSIIQDNTIWSPVGPIDGWRLRLTVGPTYNFKTSAYHNVTGLIDLRTYFRPHSSITFAHRSLAWMNEGKDIRRYYIGGSWGLRGYRWNEIYGKRVFLFSNEFRFPVLNDLSLTFRTYQIGFRPIRGAFFLDAGSAWDFGKPQWKGSAGFGLRASLMGALVLRLDIGRKTDFKSVENDWFTQFFFGWDF